MAAASKKSSEAGIVIVMALGFGLVGIDRFLISTLYPVIAKDLHLGYGDIGVIAGALAIAWGIAALFMGNLSDRIGRRLVVVSALVVFSLLIGASGLATGLMSLVLVRVVMGFADGAFTPAAISATLDASAPQRRGRNIGIQQMTLPLFGLGFAPLLVAWLLHTVDWRHIFVLFAAPGLVLAYLAWRVLPKAPAAEREKTSTLQDWKKVLSYYNVRLLAAGMLCWLTCLVTTSTLLPSYMLDHLKLDPSSMNLVMSSIGIGSAAGTLTLPWLSDRVGRKPVMIISTIGAAAMLILLNQSGPNPTILFAALFGVHFFNNTLITLTVGPICTETVPVGLMATASGVVIAIGELFGGGLAPIIGGQVADHLGIAHILWLPIGAMVAGLVLCLALKETRPTIARAESPSAA